MKSLIPIAALLVCAALAAPAAAQTQDDGLRLKLTQPITFDPQTNCISYTISSRGKTGTGTNCVSAEVPAACPPGVTAQFCQNVPIRMTLSLRGSRIDAVGAIFEAWNCATNCAVDQRWSFTVTRATGKFDDFGGGSISGGGLFVFDATTFALVSFDETLVISEADNEEVDD